MACADVGHAGQHGVDGDEVARVVLAMIRARVVLPVPGGP